MALVTQFEIQFFLQVFCYLLLNKQLEIHKFVIVVLIVSGLVLFYYKDVEINYYFAMGCAVIFALVYGILERIRLTSKPSLCSFVFLLFFFRIIVQLTFIYSVKSEIYLEYLKVFLSDTNLQLATLFSSVASFMSYWILLNYDTLTYAIVLYTNTVTIFGVEQFLSMFFVSERFKAFEIYKRRYNGFSIVVTALVAYIAIGDRDLIGELFGNRRRTNSRINAGNSIELNNNA